MSTEPPGSGRRDEEAGPRGGQRQGHRAIGPQPEDDGPGLGVQRAQFGEHLRSHRVLGTRAGHQVRPRVGDRQGRAHLAGEGHQQRGQLGVGREQAHLLVEPLGAGEPGPLLLLVGAGDRARQCDERDLVASHEQRQVGGVGRCDRLVGEGRGVHVLPHRDADHPGGGHPGEEVDLSGGPGGDAEPGGHQQVTGAEPVPGRGQLADVRPADLAVQAPGSGEHGGAQFR